jgi:hypothetical protein
MLFVASGCASSDDASTNQPAARGPMRDVFGRLVAPDATESGANAGRDPADTRAADGEAAVPGSSGWCIVLGAFTPGSQGDSSALDRDSGPGMPDTGMDGASIDADDGSRGGSTEVAAHAALFRAHAVAGLTSAYLEKRGAGYVLLYGSFESPTSRDAQTELMSIRAMNIGGQTPYADAFFAPPGATAGTMPDYDLATVKARRGTRKPLYSLQIAVYGRPDKEEATKEDLTQFRASAEEAVARLRRDGEQAYYYHGPNRSMVTIGVFSETDAGFAGRPKRESPALIVARQKFPNNLLNGEAVRERLPGRKGTAGGDFKLQPSRLVEVPD